MDQFLGFEESRLWCELRVWSQRFHGVFVISLLDGHSSHGKKFRNQKDVSWLFSDFFVLDHFNRLLIDFDQRLFHVVDCDTVGFLEILSVGFLDFGSDFSWLFAFSDLMNVKVGAGIFLVLDAVDFIGFVVSIPRNDYGALQFDSSLFSHVLDDFEKVGALEDSGAWIDLEAESVVGERHEGKLEASQDLEANFFDVILLEFRLLVESSLSKFQVTERFQFVLDLDVDDLDDLSFLLLIGHESLEVQFVGQFDTHSVFCFGLFVFCLFVF